MAAGYHTIDLNRLALSSGQGRRIEVELDPGPVELGGQEYELVPLPLSARVDVSRTVAGHAMRLRIASELRGPCMRCLSPAAIPIKVDAREVDQPGAGDEELTSPYVSDEELDLSSWARDALLLALPGSVLCSSDCRGLCPVCGERLTPDGEPHQHERPADPRWAKLRELTD
jgi:uncharacterized protein